MEGTDINNNSEIILKASSTKEALVGHLLMVEYLKAWKVPRLAAYNGVENLDNCIHAFIIGMEDMTACCNIWCHMFHHTLTDDANGIGRSL